MGFSYISYDEAVLIHRRTVEHSGGGSYEILNAGQIDSILVHVQNDDYYPSLPDKLRYMFYGFCKFHCFSDGNKRIAITICANFLLRNGYLSEAAVFLRATENITYHVASGAISEKLLNDIIVAILAHTYDQDDELAFWIEQSINDC